MKKLLFVFLISLITSLLSPQSASAFHGSELGGRSAIVSGSINNSYNIVRVNIVVNGVTVGGNNSAGTSNVTTLPAYQTLLEKLAYIQALKMSLGLNR